MSVELMTNLSRPLSSALFEMIKLIECLLNLFSLFHIPCLAPGASPSNNFQLNKTITHDPINY